MKKFSKILFLLLALVALVTAFTVVALATAEETTLSDPHVVSGHNWEASENGAQTGTGNDGMRPGYMYVEAAADGNKYAVLTPNPQKGFTGDKWYYAFDLDKTTTTKTISSVEKEVYEYNPGDYPYIVYDFDAMSPTGVIGSNLFDAFAFRTYVYGFDKNKGTTDNPNPYYNQINPDIKKMGDTGNNCLNISSTNFFGALDTTPYKWQHFTLVAKFADSNVDKKTGLVVAFEYEVELYVDGVKSDLKFANHQSAAIKAYTYGVTPYEIGLYWIRSTLPYNGSWSTVHTPYPDGFNSADPSTWNSSPSEWFDDKLAIDNTEVSYYESNWSFADIAANSYASANTPADTVKAAATIVRDGTTLYFATAEEAIAAAENGETVNVLANVAEPVEVKKAINVNAAMYYKHGTTNYFVGAYDFEWYSKDGYFATYDEATGIYSFAVSEDVYTVNFDPECTDGCDCHEKTKHILKDTALVIAGNAPAFFGGDTVFKTENGLEIIFEGWSRTKGGEVVDITAITAAKGETVNLYPVYTITQYGFELITEAGASTYYLASDYMNAFEALKNAANANSTLKLWDNVVTTKTITLNQYTQNFTLDLNGYTFSRQATTVTQYKATLGENGEYIKGERIGDPIVTSIEDGNEFFYFSSTKKAFTFTSSRPGAVMANVTVSCDQWMYNGKAVKTDNVSVTYDNTKAARNNHMFNFYPTSKGTDVKLLAENITFYFRNLVYAEHGGNGKETFYINGGTYVNLGPTTEGVFSFRNGENVTIENATFYCNGSELLKNASGTTTRNKNSKVTFNNCDIYNAKINSNADTEVFTFNNCRLDATITSSLEAKIILGENTLLTSDITTTGVTLPVPAAGFEKISVSKKLYYNNVTASSIINLDPVSLAPTAESTLNYTYVTFNYAICSPNAERATVIWKDTDGNIIDVTDEIKGLVAAAPIVPWGDGYRGVTNATWIDANDKVSDLIIGDADSYEFTAVLPEKEDAVFVGHITDAMFNITYYAHFAYNFYLPEVEGVIINKVNGTSTTQNPNKFTPVNIYGQKYICNTVAHPDSTNALTDTAFYVEYTVDGVDYSVRFRVNALMYAQLAMDDPRSTEVEKEALACLVRYIHESYKIYGSNTEETEAKFQDFYTNYRTPADYVTEYPANELHTRLNEETNKLELKNEAAVKGLIKQVHFSIVNQRVSFVVVLTDEAAEAGYKVFFSGIAYGYGNEADAGKTWYTNNTPLTRYMMQSTYWVSIKDKDGNNVYRDLDKNPETPDVKAEIQYSIPTYIAIQEANGENADFIKALYALGKAATKVREQIY